jgi:hypothetical protein
MAIHVAIWKVASQPEPLVAASLVNEHLLEDMIVAAPRLLSDGWRLIGRQEQTGYGGRIDLLAIAPDGSLVLIELKRERTPREVVAQALDYAGWIEKLRGEDIAAIYGRFAPGRSLAHDFREWFGQDFDEETLNQSHQIVIVAAELDPSTERIVAYLADRGIPINVLCFQVFGNGTEQLLSRAWLLDPVRTQVAAATPTEGTNETWNGEYYCNFGDGESRSWNEAIQYSFICAGGGSFYSRTLALLSPAGRDGHGDRIWVKAPGYGFVGVGRVTGPVQAANAFKVTTRTGVSPVLDVVKGGNYHREFLDDPERCEYFVPVRWLQTVPLDKGVLEVGLFGNQNTVCKPTTPKWRYTVERLKERFPDYNK